MIPRRVNEPDVNAQTIVAKARAKGELVPGPCKHCGSTGRVDAHHEDYFKPLDIIWLCRRCHQYEHARLRREETPVPGSHDWRRKQRSAA